MHKQPDDPNHPRSDKDPFEEFRRGAHAIHQSLQEARAALIQFGVRFAPAFHAYKEAQRLQEVADLRQMSKAERAAYRECKAQAVRDAKSDGTH